jgi:uncharacterized protein (DUF58 family)
VIPVRPLNSTLVARCDLPVGDQRRRSRPGVARSRRPGPGAELHVSREYEPGDDPRRIDWNASARNASLQVRTTTAEVAVDVHLCPSPSPSMRFGTVEQKCVVVAEALRFIAAIAARRNEQVFLHLVPGRPVRLPTRRGIGLLEGLLASPPEWSRTGDLLPVLAGLGPARGPSLVVVTVDVTTSDTEFEALRVLAATRDVLAVLVTDPAELDLPPAGTLRLGPPAGGRDLLIDTADGSLRRRYHDMVAAHLERIRSLTHAPGMDLLEISTSGEVEEMLVAQLPRRR